MKIGIIGTGAIGEGFAKHVAKAGYEVIISNSRGPESLADLVKTIGGHIKAGTVEEAAQAEVVFLSIPWGKVQEVVSGISTWEGKIIIDPSNAIAPGFVPADLGGKQSSEMLASWVPGAKVVKAFNTLMAKLLASEPKEPNGNRVIFYSGDDADAKKTVAGIIEKTGFAGVDLGSLVEGGKMQQFGGPLPLINLVKLA